MSEENRNDTTKPRSVDQHQACSARCEECLNTGIVGDEGPGRRNARHEWHPCDCPAGDAHRPRRVERFHPEWTDVEMDAISELAKTKQLSQKNIIRQAVRLYQSVALGACAVVWPLPEQNKKLTD